MNYRLSTKHVRKDLLLLCASIVFAVVLSQTELARYILGLPQGLESAAIFLAGSLFTSVFTVAPSIVIFGQLAVENSFPLVVFLGALGAVCGDYIIFSLFRNHIERDLHALIPLTRGARLKHLMRSRLIRSVLVAVGAVIIVSPLPDELGLTLMGLSKTNYRTFFIVSFIANAVGIAMVGLVAQEIV